MKPARDPEAWFRQPVLWVAMAVLVASLLGCIVTIVIASRNVDAPVPSATR